MKTTPLPEILKKITPLPYRSLVSADGIVIANDSAFDSGAASVTVVPHIRAEYEANAAYLAHAANVLPGLVKALRNCLSGDFDCCDDNLDPAKVEEIRQQARQALSLATNVPVNS